MKIPQFTNGLELHRGSTVGYYNASITLENSFMVGVGHNYEEAIDDLLKKINWVFRGDTDYTEQLTSDMDDDSDSYQRDNGNFLVGYSTHNL